MLPNKFSNSRAIKGTGLEAFFPSLVSLKIESEARFILKNNESRVLAHPRSHAGSRGWRKG